MIMPECEMMLYANFDEFLKEFWQPAHLHLQRFYNGLVQTDYFSAIRRG